MSLKMFVSEVEAYSEIDDHVFTVKTVDEGVVEVELRHRIYDAASWQVVSAGVARAIEVLQEEMECPGF
jgi:hypothetical protein